MSVMMWIMVAMVVMVVVVNVLMSSTHAHWESSGLARKGERMHKNNHTHTHSTPYANVQVKRKFIGKSGATVAGTSTHPTRQNATVQVSRSLMVTSSSFILINHLEITAHTNIKR